MTELSYGPVITFEPLDYEIRSDGRMKIAGYAAVYYREDDSGTEFELVEGVVERIAPGAFKRAMREDSVKGLFNHDSNQLLGTTGAGTLRLEDRPKGLYYEIDAGDTSVARDVLTWIKRGEVSGSSFGFQVLDASISKKSDPIVRTINEVRLFDVGPVTSPAYSSTIAEAASRERHTKRFEQLRKNREILARLEVLD